jgi:hypothetical protein
MILLFFIAFILFLAIVFWVHRQALIAFGVTLPYIKALLNLRTTGIAFIVLLHNSDGSTTTNAVLPNAFPLHLMVEFNVFFVIDFISAKIIIVVHDFHPLVGDVFPVIRPAIPEGN